MRFEPEARAWLAEDPDPVTRAELTAILTVGDEAGLASRFEQQLQFGTAGLRAELGAGPARMNRVVVARTALAIAEFLKRHTSDFADPNGKLSVVIGYDGRINSDVFALDSAKIFAGAGLRAMLFDFAVPTPVAAFTGRRLGASATVVVTASHNPPRDNGYKVYLGGALGGSQLIAPFDAEIAGIIAGITTPFDAIATSEKFERLGQAAIDSYLERALSLVAANQQRSSLKISYTAMHGVGWPVVSRLFESAGFTLGAVAAQRDADGSFPTVAFPNPEEPGAMDLSFEHATEHGSELILANDPDADRLAVALPASGGHKMLTGDEVGLILADRVAAKFNSGTLANSIVSANLIAEVAKHYGLNFEQTLTGFKWISKVPNLIFGYEEALGYCVDPVATPDKDGITAALLIADLAAELKAAGSNLSEHLAALNRRYGHMATGQVSVRLASVAAVKDLMAQLRAHPPTEFAGDSPAVEDLLAAKLSTDGLLLRLPDAAQVIIRPSGTEPKLKCYLHAPAESAEAAHERLEALRGAAEALLRAPSHEVGNA